MLENKLKYLIFGVILLSVLIVAGSLLFTFLQRFKNPPLVKQQINTSPSPNVNQPKQKTQIKIIYPSLEASKSSVPLRKPAPAPNTPTASGSASGTGSVPKSIPKP